MNPEPVPDPDSPAAASPAARAAAFRCLGRLFLWFSRWLGRVILICSAGAVAGLCLYPLVGRLLGMDLPLSRMAVNGIKDGAFYALIWAPGLSFVLCIMQAHRERTLQHDKSSLSS